MADLYSEYVWIVVVGALVAFFMAYGIGANDVANAFATSVGSKTLTLFQATILAGIFEFAGALLLGRGVTDTVRKGIAERSAFEDEPEVLMYGMLCALTAAAIWLLVATYLEMPVSTTHSIIGGIVGMALAAYGRNAVVWHKIDTKKAFPVKGISAVVISWVFSPVASGIVAAIFFLVARTFILRSQDSFNRTFIFLPVLIGIAIFINAFYVLDKGKFDKLFGGWDTSKCAWVAAIIAVGFVLISIPFSMWLKKRLVSKQAEEKADVEDAKPSNFFGKLAASVNSNDPHSVVETDEATKAIHDNAEVFDERTEDAFRYLQVLTSCCDAFAHGANDVANSIGPFSAIWHVYREQELTKKSDVPVWILVIGGGGIVVGLATYGYKIIKAIGVKLTKITPSRGYAIEMGSALIVVTGSYLGLPLSTTHCQVGATAFVGLLEGVRGISYNVMMKTIFGWIFTLIIVGLISALLMVLGLRTPNLVSSKALTSVEAALASDGPKVMETAAGACNSEANQADAEAGFYFFKNYNKNFRYNDLVGDAVAYMSSVTAGTPDCTFVGPAAFVNDDEETPFASVAEDFIATGKEVQQDKTLGYYEDGKDGIEALIEDGVCNEADVAFVMEVLGKVVQDTDELDDDGKPVKEGALFFPESSNADFTAAKDLAGAIEEADGSCDGVLALKPVAAAA